MLQSGLIFLFLFVRLDVILFCNQVLNSLLKDASTVTIYKDVEHTNVNICNNPRSLEGGGSN